MAKTKGKPRHYEEWQPEYTPKTKNLTAKSKRELNEIRAQSIAEGTIDHLDIRAITDGMGFAGLVVAFRYGINPVLLELLKGLVKFTADIPTGIAKVLFPVFFLDELTQFEIVGYDITQEDLEKLVDKGLAGKKKGAQRELNKLYDKKTAKIQQIGNYQRLMDTEQENIDKLSAHIQEGAAEGLIGEKAFFDKVLLREQMFLKRDNYSAIIHGGMVVTKYDIQELGSYNVSLSPTEWDDVPGLNAELTNIETEIADKKAQIEKGWTSMKDAEDIQKDIDWTLWLTSCGEAGALMWLLKSYKTSEIVEHIPGQ